MPGSGYMCVDFRNIDRTMPEHLLDTADIHIRLQQVGGEGMPEHMRRNMLLDVSHGSVLLNHISYRLFRQPPVDPVDKEPAAGFQFGAVCVFIFGQCGQDVGAADLNPAFLRTLSMDQDISVLQIQVGSRKGTQFRNPNAGGK